MTHTPDRRPTAARLAVATFRVPASCTIAVLALAIASTLPAMAAADAPTKDLAAVVVTATSTERPVATAPASVTVVTGETLRSRPARDVLDAIRDTPGLNIRAVGSLGRRVVNIRGMESRHTLVLVDGERIAATDQVFGLSDLQFGWIPLEAIERVEIVRGPLSSLYGSDALGGVINIITRGDAKQWRGSLRGTYGYLPEDDGGNERQASAYVSGPLSQTLSLTVTAAHQQQTPVPEPRDPRLAQREGLEQSSVSARLQWRPSEDHRLALTVMKGDEDRWYGTKNSAGTLYYRQSYDFDRTHVGLSYDAALAGGHLQVRGYVADIHQRQINTQGVAPSPEQEAGEKALDGHYGIALGESHRLTTGFELRRERLEHPSFAGGEEEVGQHALFAQDEWAMSPRFDVVYGVRWDKHDLFGSEFSPRLYAVWKLSDAWTLKGGYSRGFKAPMLKQISPDYRFDGPHSFVGNPDVQPEKSDNLEAALAYASDTLWGGLTVYRNTVKDLIDTVCIQRCTLPLRRLYRYENVDDARIRGAEAEFGLQLAPQWQLTANYAYSDARDQGSDERLAERPLQSGNVRLAWSASDWQSELRYEYIGRQMVYPASTGAPMLEQPSYGLWNASLRRRFGERFSVQLGVENLTDHRVEADGDPYNFRERGRFIYTTLGLGF